MLEKDLPAPTKAEQYLMARMFPVYKVVRARNSKGQMVGVQKLRNHVAHFRYDPGSFVSQLPRRVKDLPLTIFVEKDTCRGDGSTWDFCVRRKVILGWLKYFKYEADCPAYKDIIIDYEALSELPENGQPDGFEELITQEPTDEIDLGAPAQDFGEDTGPVDNHPDASKDYEFLVAGSPDARDKSQYALISEAVDKAIKGTRENPVKFAPIDTEPVKEYEHEYFFAHAFPWLFMFGKGGGCDPTAPREEDKIKKNMINKKNKNTTRKL